MCGSLAGLAVRRGALLLTLFLCGPAATDPYGTIALGGDVLPGRGVAREAARAGDPFFPYAAIAGFLRSSDLALANLECSLVAGPPVALTEMRLRADPAVAPLLVRAGFGILSLANNHALDHGPEGLASTRAALARAGILAADPEGLVVTVKGIRIGVLAACDPDVPPGRGHVGDLTPEALASAVHALKTRSDVVIVSLHAGREYDAASTDSQRALSRAAVGAGASLVLGHHAHVLQPAEWLVAGVRPPPYPPNVGGVWGGRTPRSPPRLGGPGGAEPRALALYGLGNLVFDQMGRPQTRESALIRAHLDPTGVRAAEVLPLRQRRMGRPEPVEGAEGRAIAMRLGLPLLPAFSREEDTWRESLLFLPPGRALEDPPRQADADGDGRVERVRVAAGRAILSRDGREIWRSPEELRVVDACIANLRGEGRPQVALALWKQTPEGLRSCLWLYGWFRGRWNPRWCSSRLDRPIVAFAPLPTPPGKPSEIAIVEGDYGGGLRRTLSVWRWNGWGFTLLWRSRPGPYARVRIAGPAIAPDPR